MKVLFLFHEATYTGAPIVLLHVIRWMVRERGLEPLFVCRRGGPLVDELEALGATWLAGKDTIPVEPLHGVELVYANSVQCADLLPAVAGLGVPVVCHVHELDHELRLLSYDEQGFLKKFATGFIACSEGVKAALSRVLGISVEKVEVVTECVPVDEVRARAAESDRSAVRKNLGVSVDAKVVGAAGVVSWRKGTDFFVQLAAHLQERRDIVFVWLGLDPEDEWSRRLAHDVDQLGLRDRVVFAGRSDDPYAILNAFDLFCLPSREDPFPLVMIEAAACGKPMVGFLGSGGCEEFCARGGGRLVPYGDVGKLGQAVESVLDDATLRDQLTHEVSAAAERCDVALKASRIADYVSKLIATGIPQRPDSDGVDRTIDLLGGYPRIQADCRVDIAWVESDFGGQDPLIRSVVINSISSLVGHFQCASEVGPRTVRFRIQLGGIGSRIEILQAQVRSGTRVVELAVAKLTCSAEMVALGDGQFVGLGKRPRIYTPKVELEGGEREATLEMKFRFTDDGVAQVKDHIEKRRGGWLTSMQQKLRGGN